MALALGDLGTQAAADRVRAALGDGSLASGARWTVRGGVEIRSSGDLRLSTDWTVPAAEGALPATGPLPGAAGIQAGGTAVTLVAAGALHLDRSLSSGFAPTSPGQPAGSAAPLTGSAGALRLHAGGDLDVGNPADAGGFAPPEVVLRNTSGRIELQAGGDVRLAHPQVAVYTTGVPVLPEGQDDPNQFGAFLGYVTTDLGAIPPFLQGGGTVSVLAGGDLVGARPTSATRALPGSWAWRGSDGTQGLWWSRHDLFRAGVGSFGGGDVVLRAGGSVVDVAAAAADSGFILGTGGADASVTRFGGGALRVEAGGDLLGGNFLSSGPALSLRAGGRIGAGEGGALPDIVYQDTAVTLSARGDVGVARLQSFGFAAPSVENSAGDLALLGLDGGASLWLGSAAGNVTLAGEGQTGRQDEVSTLAWGSLGATLPAVATVAAPQGGITLQGTLVQRADVEGRLQLLAGDALTIGNLDVAAGGAAPRPAAIEPVAALDRALLDLSSVGGAGGDRTLDATAREPVQAVAQQGDLVVGGRVQSARPVRLLAGRDLALEGAAQLVVQHQGERLDGTRPVAVSEISLLQAGRDMTAARASSALAGVTVAGSGDLVLIAGRDIDLGASRGVQAVGNQRNSTLLPAQGADLTLLAGYRFDGRDLQRAAEGSYAITGLNALAAAPGEIVAWLGGETAAAFDALPLAARLQALQALHGDAYDERLAHWLRAALAFGMAPAKAQTAAAAARQQLGGDSVADAVVTQIEQAAPAERAALVVQALARNDVRSRLELSNWLRAVLAQTLDAGSARATLAALDTPLQQAAVGGLAALALQAAPQSVQDGFVQAQLAARPADDPVRTQAAALSDYLERVAGVQAEGVAALQALRALPLERQLPWLARRLGADLADAGARAAEAGAGTGFDAAYAPAYLSFDQLFPLAGRGTGDASDAGDIVTPTSQVRTAQKGDITLLAPSGGVNAGALVPGAIVKAANELGIVTVAGGDILAAVRDNFEVNQSRVFTLAQGDILLWSSDGNVDAGRGAKTVTGAPAPVLRLDADGNLVLDTSGSFSGSGIAALDADSNVGLFAPRGEVNAGEAGISAGGNLTIGAVRVVGADNIASSGYAGTAGDLPSGGATASLASLGNAVAAATAAAIAPAAEAAAPPRRRRNLFLDFLGFGSGDE